MNRTSVAIEEAPAFQARRHPTPIKAHGPEAFAGMRKAGSTDTEKLITAFRGLSFDSPYGKLSFRAVDHQSTMGAFLGRTKNEGGKGVLVDYRYIDGASVQPSDDVVKKLRPSN